MNGPARDPRALDCSEARLSLGVLVLGAIEPEERPALEEHLVGCPACSAALAELAALPGLLQTVDVDEIAAGPATDPSELERRLLTAGRSLARRRRRATVIRRAGIAAGAAAAAVVAGVLLVQGPGQERPADQASGLVTTAVNPTTAVRARFAMQPAPIGTRLRVALSGVRPGQHCRLVAIDHGGHRDVAASWVASYRGSASVTGSTAMPVADIARLAVVDPDGAVLVSTQVR